MSSDLKVTNIKHESSGSNNLVLASDGNVSITNTLSAGTLGSSVVGGNMSVGTVSESSGTPTGDIIQRGSNSNGEYVRYADGTQICTIKDIVSGGDSGATWTFPIAFTDEPSVGGTSGANPLRFDFGSGSNPVSSTSWTFQCGVLSASTGSGLTVGMSTSNQNLLAIGRWY